MTDCGKLLKKWEYQTTLPASWETCIWAKKQQLEPDMEQPTGSKLGKEYIKTVYCHLAYLTYMQSTSYEMPGWINKAQAGIKIPKRNINNLSYADDTTLMTENEKKLTSLLMRVKEETEKAGLTLNNQKTMIMASGHIISWQIEGGEMEAVTCFIFLDSKITGDDDYSHEIKRHFLLEKKTMTNLDSILKVETQVHIFKAMVFPVVIYRWESRTIRKAECWRINAFKMWHWRRLLRVPWIARRSILKEKQ